MSEPMTQGMLACNFASQDKFNRWNLIAVFDTQYVPVMPGVMSPHVIWARVCDMPPRGEARVQIEKETGVVIWASPPVSFQSNNPVGPLSIEMGFGIPAVTVTSYGKYRYAILVNDFRAGDLVMTVEQMPPAAI